MHVVRDYYRYQLFGENDTILSIINLRSRLPQAKFLIDANERVAGNLAGGLVIFTPPKPTRTFKSRSYAFNRRSSEFSVSPTFAGNQNRWCASATLNRGTAGMERADFLSFQRLELIQKEFEITELFGQHGTKRRRQTEAPIPINASFISNSGGVVILRGKPCFGYERDSPHASEKSPNI